MFLLVLVVGIVLAYWSIVDWREHEIEDGQTLGFLAAAFLMSLSMTILQQNPAQFGESLAAAGVFALFGYLLYRIDWWGGADVKIIAGLGLLANPMVFGAMARSIWPYPEISFFLNLCICSIVFFAAAETYYWITTKRIEKEVPYVPAFFLAWAATAIGGDLLMGLLRLAGY